MPFSATHPLLARALQERDYASATPVQAAVLEERAAGRDLLVSAQTGSGKTVAYGLAIGGTILGDEAGLAAPAEPLALIVAPTRELALQVQRELDWLYRAAGARVVSCVGGMDPKAERRRLQSGAHIVIGTPGRLRDHIERGGLDVSALRVVVLDEADEMLDLGFREDLDFILETTPAERRTLLFSATMPRAIAAMARRFQRDALRIEVTGESLGHVDIEYRAVRIVPNETEHAVVNLLRYVDAPAAIVFCNTRDTVRRLQAALLERGFAVVALSGELGQNDRNHALQALRDGRARVCVATDVAARGIDLPGLDLVIHADLPHDSEVLQHRSGRTGRAGRKGTSVLLVPLSRRRKAEGLMANAGIVPSWSGPPTLEEIRALDETRLLEDPTIAEAPAEEDLAMARSLLERRSAEEVAAALVRIWRARLPAPEEVFDPGDRPTKERRDPAIGGEPRAPRQQIEGGAWFHMAIGRRENADPKWLLPMICRRGNVTRTEIGAIRIFERETKFEVSAEVAPRFAQAVRRGGPDDIAIQPIGAAAADAAPNPYANAAKRPGKARPKDGAGKHADPRRQKPREDGASQRAAGKAPGARDGVRKKPRKAR